jgi:hypothetical protein
VPISESNFHYVTIKCDGKNCEKTATFEQKQEGVDIKVKEDNPWINTVRPVRTSDGRVYSYCSDLCEISGIEAGLHNPIEKPKVEVAQGSMQAQIAAALEMKKRQEEFNKAVKNGGPITLETR